ncbi:hypothetical protein F5890DRAFT_1418942 [Lentinula detonsa]|uniref:C2H2-type domain-containing protein n=1 Tax=Lentinula detonsa TaxID=2804962 RepID=A0AA38UNP8_9AGAR|nr:hypothetical protein F5890DRAFT_1418942 [Lentinula detonsa]
MTPRISCKVALLCSVFFSAMQRLHCQFAGCLRTFRKNNDLTKHVNLKHAQYNTGNSPASTLSLSPVQLDTSFEITPPLPPLPWRKDTKKIHPYLSGMSLVFFMHFYFTLDSDLISGEICDENGHPLLLGTQPPPKPSLENPWAPFLGEAQFRLADLLFKDVEMSQGNIDKLLDIWSLYQHQISPDYMNDGPFSTHQDLYSQIDNISDGSAPWKCLQTVVDDTLPPSAPEWKKTSYQVWYRDPDQVIANILSNPEFASDFDVAPYVHLDAAGTRRWSDFMSGNYAWRHATQAYKESAHSESLKGTMLVPIILGADKTMVSVATGHVEYHPLYLSIGNVTNAARRAHKNAVIPVGFLAIPKADRKYDNDNDFCIFKKQLYHSSIAAILRSLKSGMSRPLIRKCPDGYFRRVLYDLAAFIADYPEQVYLSGVVQGWYGRCTAIHSNLDDLSDSDRRTRALDQILREEYGGEGCLLWNNFGMDKHVIPFTEHFPRADIHEMLSPDLLHQIIKGCFKDMLVEWVWEYLVREHGEARANEIMDDIDLRLAIVPAFPGLRRFPHGRRFKQWTGNDSKALMKIFLPAVAEYLPEDIMKCLSAFLEFCYLVRRSDIDENCLKSIQRTIETFHHYRDSFKTLGVREHFSLPRMHSIVHYPLLITEFGAPNGLDSSITESRHITAVKKPWRRSNRNAALSQILLTNQRNDKLSALRSRLVDQNLIISSTPSPLDLFDVGNEDVGPIDSGRALADVKLAKTREPVYPRHLPELSVYICQPHLEILTRQFLQDQLDLPITDSDSNLPLITSKINVYHSAIAVFYAPSDNSGIRGMKRERIRSTPSWYGCERRDTVLAVIDEAKPGFSGMSVARVYLFFSFQHGDKEYPCALIQWFNTYGQRRDSKTGLWMVKPVVWDQAQPQSSCSAQVVHLESLIRGVHLIPVFGSHPVPPKLKYNQSLDVFKLFYVNKFADYHTNEILFC